MDKPSFFKEIKRDIAAIKKRDPAARSTLEILLAYSGLHALILYRIAHRLHKIGLKLFARMLSQFAKFITGVEIHPAAEIGSGVLIDHGSGVVIGETAEVGNDVTIYQGVTLGGTGKDRGKRHPSVQDGVVIGVGAKVLGPFTVGKFAKIGAGSVVLGEVPPSCTVVGVPAKIVKLGGRRVQSVYDTRGALTDITAAK